MSKPNIFLSFLPQKKHNIYKSKPETNSLTTNHGSSFEENRKFILEYLSKTKHNLTKKSSQSTNFLGFSKNHHSDNSNKGYLISGLNSETKQETSNQNNKNSNYCVIQINIKNEKFRFNVDCTNKTSEWLVNVLIEKIQNFEPQNKKSSEISKSPIIGFSNNAGFILIDYIMTLKNIKLEFLHNMIIVFNPVYADTLFLNLKHSKQSLKSFEFLKLIGSGGFSKVFLARSKINGEYHAIKLIDRDFIRTHQKEGIVLNERNILASMNHPNIIKLDFAFKSKKYIVFVMEFCAGGELFYHLKRVKRMTENEARVYFLELCLGIKHLHEKFIVYRDIKPENILLDIHGHVKIADFGLAKPDMNILKKAHSFCGSPEYMAPEMLQKKGHDYSVDYYCLGAILYELIVGSPPFYTTHTSEMFNRILTEEISFPEDLDLSNEIIDLITNLLIKDPKYRRGSMGGIKEILAHPWCKKINLKDIESKSVDAPIKPNFFEFYVDEVSDDGDLSGKMQDIYDEAFDDLSEDDENEQIFQNFYFENEKSESNFNYDQKINKSATKQKHFLSYPDFDILQKKSQKIEAINKNYNDLKDSMNKVHLKNIHSDNFQKNDIKINKFEDNKDKINGPYFIAEQYRAKKSQESFLNVYNSFLKNQRSLDYQLTTSPKEKYFADRKNNGTSMKKLSTEGSYNNTSSKFQPYIPINKSLLKKYKDKQNLSKEDIYFKNIQKYNSTIKKTPLNVNTTNLNNVSHVKKTDILNSINLRSLLKIKQKENVLNKGKNAKTPNFFNEKSNSSSDSRLRLSTEPTSSINEWKHKKFLIDDIQNCKDTLKKMEKKIKEGTNKKIDEKKFFGLIKKGL